MYVFVTDNRYGHSRISNNLVFSEVLNMFDEGNVFGGTIII